MITELGYGNNAVEMETTAIYDRKTDEFVIHTPSTLAQKYWITNSAIDARYWYEIRSIESISPSPLPSILSFSLLFFSSLQVRE